MTLGQFAVQYDVAQFVILHTKLSQGHICLDNYDENDDNNDDDCHCMININIPILFQIFQSLVVYATNCTISYRYCDSERV